MLLHDEDAGRDAADRELLVALDARAFALGDVADERDQRVDRVGQPFGMDLPRRAHPAEDSELMRLGHHRVGIELAAGGAAQGPLARGRRHGPLPARLEPHPQLTRLIGQSRTST